MAANPPMAASAVSKTIASASVFARLPPDRAPEHTERALAAIASEARRQLSADCLLIALHERGVLTTLAIDGDPDAQEACDMRRCSAHSTLGMAADKTWFTSQNRSGETLTAPIAVADGQVTVTAHYRGVAASSQAEVRGAATNLLSILTPFFRLWSERLESAQRSRGLTDALNKSDIGVMLVGRSGRIVFANRIAKMTLAEGSSIRQAGEVLIAKNFADTLRLQAAIDHVISSGGRQDRAAAPFPVLAIGRDKRRALLAAIVACDSAGDDDPLAIIHLFDPEEDLQLFLEPVCKLYGLSPVEAKLTCLLADGLSLGAAAERMHVRELTARSYLKQVFLKTDTKRQAELVLLMLKSTVRISAGCPMGLV